MVTEAGDGAEALAMLGHKPVDVIISDILMPKMDGYQLCYEIRRKPSLAELPFIFYSNTCTSPADERLAMRVGGDKFLRKPATVSQIIDIMKEVATRQKAPAVTLEEKEKWILQSGSGELFVKKLEEKTLELEQRTRLAALTVDVSLALAHGDTLQKMLERCVKSITQNLHAAFAMIWTWNEKEKVLELQASAGTYTHIDGGYARVPLGQLEIGLIAQELTPCVTNSVIGDTRVSDQAWARREGLVSFAGFPLIVSGRLVGVVAMFAREPLTELTLEGLAAVADTIALGIHRKHSEEALRESELKFHQFCENAREVFWMAAKDHSRLIYVSPAYETIWGRSCQSLYADPHSFIEAIHPADRARVMASLDAQKKGQPYDEEYRIVRPDNSVRWVRDRGFPIRDREGEIDRVAGFAEEITEKKSLEAQFIKAQRMESIGRLTSGVAHDLNNILAPIVMITPLLRMGVPRQDTDKALAQIEASAQRGAQVVKQLLTLARGVEGQRGLVQPKHLLQEIGHMVQETFPKSISVQRTFPKDLWSLTANATQIYQVLLNLCVNARDAMPNGGQLRLAAENVRIDQVPLFDSEVVPGPYVLMQVQDTGLGMSAELISKIFDPFFTTKEPGKGTGLGLATVQCIVRDPKGYIEVKSEVGKGTIFNVYMPATLEAPKPEGSAACSRMPAGHGEYILVVDDEKPMRETTSKILEQAGYQVMTASDGREGVAAFAKFQDRIRAVICDLMMPGLDGTAMAAILKKINPQIQIIISSGLLEDSACQNKIAELKQMGVESFLTKPYQRADLLRNVHRALLGDSDE